VVAGSNPVAPAKIFLPKTKRKRTKYD
jgi:hypothetical protein